MLRPSILMEEAAAPAELSIYEDFGAVWYNLALLVKQFFFLRSNKAALAVKLKLL